MGYGVYWVPDNNRWEGYLVPAVCDWPTCNEVIDHGLDYRCEEHGEWVLDEDAGDEMYAVDVGCNLTFCDEHMGRYDHHEDISPKPNTLEWLRWVLTDDSWARWRVEYPQRAQEYRERVGDEV